MHDMRDLMKSLAHDQESMLNASRSNFIFSRSIYQQGGADYPYNAFGSSSNFRGTGRGSLVAAPIGNPNPSSSMLQFS